MGNNLTDREYWAAYWADYYYEEVPKRMIYEREFRNLKNKNSFIEIGGFPGINCAYFYKNGYRDVTLLDFYIDHKIVTRFERFNKIPEGSIQCIEADFFANDISRKFDVVFSSGFIEHFENTEDVIVRHVALLEENGELLVILPNFRGINGVIQYLFDRGNYNAHNIRCMDCNYLAEICKKQNLKNVKVTYYRRPMVWLEPKNRRLNKWMKWPIKLLSCGLKLFPIPCRLLSAFIIITARKG